MKGTPDAPQCGYNGCFKYGKNIRYKVKNNVLENKNIREDKNFSDWPTIPQLYINKEFVGGCDIVKEMYENGELKSILNKNSLI